MHTNLGCECGGSQALGSSTAGVDARFTGQVDHRLAARRLSGSDGPIYADGVSETDCAMDGAAREEIRTVGRNAHRLLAKCPFGVHLSDNAPGHPLPTASSSHRMVLA
jgi:hypothetical protein